MRERRRAMMGLPKKYGAEIEYLESNGTGQYINTNIIPTSATTFTVDMSITNTGDVQNGLIQYVSGTNQRFHLGKYQGYFQGGIGTVYKDCTSHNTNRHTFSLIGSGTIKIDNSSYSCAALGTVTIPIFIFGRNTNGMANCFIAGKLYSSKIYNSSELVMDLIPVRVGQVGYLYDKVSDTLFGNSGTGSFTLGPDISDNLN